MKGFGSSNGKTKKSIKTANTLHKDQLISNAFSLHSNGKIKEASEIYNFLIQNKIYDPRVFNNLGSIYCQRKHFDKAISLFDESIKRFPNSLEAYTNLANVLVIKGKSDFARKILNKAIELNPKYLRPYSVLAGILVGEGNLKKAEFILRKSLEINPKDINALVNLACVLKDLGNPKQAERFLRDALEINPKHSSALVNLGAVLNELGKSIELAKSELGITIPPEDATEGWTTEWHVDNSKWLEAIYGKINNGILLIIDYAKEAKKYYNSKNSDGTIVSYENQKMINNVLDSPGNCDLTSHVCIETLINDAETLGFNTLGITKQGEALLALGLAERLYGIQKEFKGDLSNALLRREALLRLVDPVCLGNFKWFVFKKFKEKEMNINSTCLR